MVWAVQRENKWQGTFIHLKKWLGGEFNSACHGLGKFNLAICLSSLQIWVHDDFIMYEYKQKVWAWWVELFCLLLTQEWVATTPCACGESGYYKSDGGLQGCLHQVLRLPEMQGRAQAFEVSWQSFLCTRWWFKSKCKHQDWNLLGTYCCVFDGVSVYWPPRMLKPIISPVSKVWFSGHPLLVWLCVFKGLFASCFSCRFVQITLTPN